MITYGASHPSLGVLIGLPILMLALAGVLVLGRYLGLHEWDKYDIGMARVGSMVCLIGGPILFVAIIALGYFPYSVKYHEWQHISGTVTSTNSRFLASDHGTSQKFVVTFDGSEQQFGCNDTRCSTVREGDDLTITCKRVWQWFGTPGYDCNFVSLTRK